jgi:hypothetical protein
MTDEHEKFERSGNNLTEALSWHLLSEGLRKTTQNLSQDNQCTSQGSNWGPPTSHYANPFGRSYVNLFTEIKVFLHLMLCSFCTLDVYASQEPAAPTLKMEAASFSTCHYPETNKCSSCPATLFLERSILILPFKNCIYFLPRNKVGSTVFLRILDTSSFWMWVLEKKLERCTFLKFKPHLNFSTRKLWKCASYIQ